MTPAELHAAIAAVCPIDGVSLDHLDDKSTWRVHFKDAATSAQQAAAQTVIDAAAVVLPAPISYAALRGRMTEAERQALLEGARADWRVQDFVLWAAAAGTIDLNSAEVAAAKVVLVAARLIDPQRAEAIFAPA